MTETKSDKTLYKEFLNGNKASFEELVLRHKNSIIYFISRYTKNEEIAEDISQDVFVYLLMNKNKYDAKFSFKTYLFIIAKSKALNYIKRERKIVSIEENYIVDEKLEEEVFKKEKLQNINKIICKMKQDYQIAIYLADFEGLSYKEIGKILKKSDTYVKNLIHRAREKLKQLLRKEGITYEN